MASENLVLVPRSDLIIEVPMAQVPAAPLNRLPTPTQEQVQVVDGVFTQTSDDRSAMGLLGVWGSVLLLHDLAAEHLSPPRDLEEPRGKLPRPDDEPEGEPAE
jgi:hypothetical protein